MQQDFSPSMAEEERTRTPGHIGTPQTSSVSQSRLSYGQGSTPSVDAPLDFQGLPTSGSLGSEAAGSRIASSSGPVPEGNRVKPGNAMIKGSNDVVHSVEYSGIAPPDTAGFRNASVSQGRAAVPTRSLEDRHLPPREVTDGSLDNAYVAFVLYCNPAVPLSTNSEELRKIFRSPPRSDGKTFSTFTLFELIRKLEEKEIKTWTQLAIQLGVDPPSAEKNQSSQKVQQYAVRLKVSLRPFSSPFMSLLQSHLVSGTRISRREC